LSVPPETVVLTLKNLVYRHSEYVTLGDYLVEKYGFKTIEEVEHPITEMRELYQIDRSDVVLEHETEAPIVLEAVDTKTASHKIYEGSYMDQKIKIYVMGDIARTEDLVEISDTERYKVYTAQYQMIKLLGESGYALQKFIENVSVELGLKIEAQVWSFHRVSTRIHQ